MLLIPCNPVLTDLWYSDQWLNQLHRDACLVSRYVSRRRTRWSSAIIATLGILLQSVSEMWGRVSMRCCASNIWTQTTAQSSLIWHRLCSLFMPGRDNEQLVTETLLCYRDGCRCNRLDRHFLLLQSQFCG